MTFLKCLENICFKWAQLNLTAYLSAGKLPQPMSSSSFLTKHLEIHPVVVEKFFVYLGRVKLLASREETSKEKLLKLGQELASLLVNTGRKVENLHP